MSAPDSLSPWTELRPRVYTAVAEPETVNIGLVVGDEHVLLVDTGSTPEQGRAIAASVLDLVGRPVDRVVVTHDHHDHIGGLSGVGAEMSIGHETLPNLTHPMVLAKALDLGGIRVEIIHYGPAHTPGDVIVMVPDAKVVFCGDLVETNGDPSFEENSSVATWPRVIDGALVGADEQTLFMPGHGPVADRLTVFDQRSDIVAFYGQVESMIGHGTKLDAALASLEDTEWPFATATVRAALPRLYAELEAKGVVPRMNLPLLGGVPPL